MLRFKIKTIGLFQFAEVGVKLANFLRAFGWLVKKNSEHKARNGKTVVSIRRAVEFAKDAIVRKNEKIFLQNYDKATGGAKIRFNTAQVFTILFTLICLPLGLLYILKEAFDNLSPLTCGIDLAIKDVFMGFAAENVANKIAFSARFVFLGIGIICLIFLFLNKSIYLKNGSDNLSAGKKKYVVAVRESLRNGNDRVYQIKTDNPHLMTKEDRKLRGIEDTIQHALDGRDEEYS